MNASITENEAGSSSDSCMECKMEKKFKKKSLKRSSKVLPKGGQRVFDRLWKDHEEK